MGYVQEDGQEILMNKIFNCDIMEGFSKLDNESVDCVITSPPYWQLRDYGFDGQWGLEPTFEEYLENLWKMMDEIHRVLKDTGTVWINLGDTYSTKSAGSKSLLLIPHRFAIGCYDRGWTIRNDIIWAKINGMPEPVRDRFSKKHEYIFLMTKSPTGYYFDLDSIRDEHLDVSIRRAMRGSSKNNKYSGNVPDQPANTMGKERKNVGYTDMHEKIKNGDTHLNKNGKNPGDVSDFWNIPTKGNQSNHYASYNSELIDKPIIAGCPEGGIVLDPFSGTGTTLVRASQLGRQYVGFEASEQFFKITEENIQTEDKRINEQTLEVFYKN
jgi:DNA modification methylase